MSPPPVSARFDDLSGAGVGRSMVGQGFSHEIVAERLDEVPAAIVAAERAASDGRWVAGFIAYDAAPALDPGLVVPGDTVPTVPLCWFGVFDGVDGGVGLEPHAATVGGPWSLSLTPAEHTGAVASIKAHIAAGDTYQVNLTGRLRATGVDPAALYAQLLHAQRPAYGALLHTPTHVVASASPELFLSWHDGALRCRPMKGTAARGRWAAEDDAARTGLAASPKDRAENVMIVDLIRNDLGRVCEYGTVVVERLFDVEAYPTVWQMTSQVVGRSRPDVQLLDIIRALFPCGSVTGAPKQRTMELIADLEPHRRGLYCGAIGWLGPDGAGGVEARFSVAIRTAVVDRATDVAEFGSGGGIVWDSDPAAEWDELAAKAAALTAPVTGFDLVETLHGDRHLDRHLRRLADSAARFGFAFDAASARAQVIAAGAGRVRLQLARSGRLDITVADLPPVDDAPAVLAMDDEPVCSTDPMLFHKTTRRDGYARRRARHPEADDVLLQNERGEVTESTIANVAYLLDGRWWTPPLDAGCLPGVGREVLLEEGILAERTLPVADLADVDALALVSSLRGWRPAVLGPGNRTGAAGGRSTLDTIRDYLAVPRVLTEHGVDSFVPLLERADVREVGAMIVMSGSYRQPLRETREVEVRAPRAYLLGLEDPLFTRRIGDLLTYLDEALIDRSVRIVSFSPEQ